MNVEHFGERLMKYRQHEQSGHWPLIGQVCVSRFWICLNLSVFRSKRVRIRLNLEFDCFYDSLCFIVCSQRDNSALGWNKTAINLKGPQVIFFCEQLLSSYIEYSFVKSSAGRTACKRRIVRKCFQLLLLPGVGTGNVWALSYRMAIRCFVCLIDPLIRVALSRWGVYRLINRLVNFATQYALKDDSL